MRNVFSVALAIFAFGILAFPHASFAAVSEPQDLTVVGGRFTNDTTPTFTWDAVSGATSYEVAVAGDGQEINVGTRTTYTSPTLTDGWYSFTVRAIRGSSESTWASVVFEVDTQGPRLNDFDIDTNRNKVTFSVSARPDESYTLVGDCTLEVKDVGSYRMMIGTGSYFTYTVRFDGADDYRARISCDDTDGNVTTTTWKTFVSGDEIPPVELMVVAKEGDRIKIACRSKASVSDACHAVYYYGKDGKRHIFPDEVTYKTWYSNWSGIKTVSSDFMNKLALGEPVTVHPGKVVVKFQSDDDIYAVSEGGVLHHYINELLLKVDYSNAWQQFLRILPDAWRSHYEVGSQIDSSGDYDPLKAKNEVTSIDDNF